MKRLRIAHLIASNFFGGPEKQILEHARRLRESPFEVCLISYHEGTKNEFLEQARREGLSTLALPARIPFDPRAIIDLSAALRRENVGLLVTHHYKANVLGTLAATRVGIPKVSVSRGWTGENRKVRFYEWLDKRFLRFADEIVAVSEGQRAKILALGVDPRRVRVIHNCIDLENSPPRAEIPLRWELRLCPETLLIASAGRLSPEKNIEGLIRVAARVMACSPRAVFVVFGEGVLRRRLEEAVRKAGLQGSFLLPGFREDFAAVLPQIDIFVLPSLTEGLPNVILEAFAARKPVVATAVGGTPEVVVDGEGGYLVRPGDEEKMAERILELMHDSELRRQMGEMGQRRVCETFSPRKQAEAYFALYEAMVRRRTERYGRGDLPAQKGWKV